jgi:hypothetical protein
MGKILTYSILGAGAVLVVAGLATKHGSAGNGNNGNNGNGNNGLGPGLTFTAGQFAAMAEELYRAKGYVNDDEDAFYRVFESLRTPADLSNLVFVFGEKQPYPFADALTLVQWVQNTLSPTEQARVKAVFDKFNQPFR